MSDQQPESFEEATSRLSTFLQANGRPEKIVWTDGSDVIWNGKELLVKEPNNDRSWDAARIRYFAGVGRGLGICLHAFAVTTTSTIASVFVPTDEDERQRSLMGKGLLKLSVSEKPFRARVARNGLIWLFASLRHRKSTQVFVDFVLRF